MDGTLLATIDGRREIPQATVKALACYQKAGGRWSVATGRSLDQVQEKLAKLHPDLPLVLFNGALRVDPTSHEPLKPEPPRLKSEVVSTVEAVARNWRDDKCAPAPSCVLGFVVHGAMHTVGNPFLPSGSNSTEFDEAQRLWEAFLSQGDLRTPDVALPVDDPTIKVMIVTRDEEHGATDELRDELKEDLLAKLREHGYLDLSVVTSNETVEVMPANTDKAVAIEHTLLESGISWNDVLIFGDNGNDISMLDRGLGVVVLHKEKAEPCHPGACAVSVAQVSGPEALAHFIREVAVRGECLTP